MSGFDWPDPDGVVVPPRPAPDEYSSLPIVDPTQFEHDDTKTVDGFTIASCRSCWAPIVWASRPPTARPCPWTRRSTPAERGNPTLSGAAADERYGRYAGAVVLWEEITGVPAPPPIVEGGKSGRRLNPELSEWMMGYPPGYLTDVMGRSDALRCAGNGVVTLHARAAWDLLRGDDW